MNKDFDIRSATLENGIANTDQIFGMVDAVQESIEATFGKMEHGAQPETGKKLSAVASATRAMTTE